MKSKIIFAHELVKTFASVEPVSGQDYCNTEMTASAMRDVDAVYTLEFAHSRQLLGARAPNERSLLISGLLFTRTNTKKDENIDDFVIRSVLQCSDHIAIRFSSKCSVPMLCTISTSRLRCGQVRRYTRGRVLGRTLGLRCMHSRKPTFAHAHAQHDAERCCGSKSGAARLVLGAFANGSSSLRKSISCSEILGSGALISTLRWNWRGRVCAFIQSIFGMHRCRRSLPLVVAFASVHVRSDLDLLREPLSAEAHTACEHVQTLEPSVVFSCSGVGLRAQQGSGQSKKSNNWRSEWHWGDWCETVVLQPIIHTFRVRFGRRHCDAARHGSRRRTIT